MPGLLPNDARCDGGSSTGLMRWVLAAAAAQVAAAGETVTYQDGATELEGYLAVPAGASGPLPVVLHVHAWTGISDFERGRADRTAAEHGYVGFAVSVFDKDETALTFNMCAARSPDTPHHSSCVSFFFSRGDRVTA